MSSWAEFPRSLGCSIQSRAAVPPPLPFFQHQPPGPCLCWHYSPDIQYVEGKGAVKALLQTGSRWEVGVAFFAVGKTEADHEQPSDLPKAFEAALGSRPSPLGIPPSFSIVTLTFAPSQCFFFTHTATSPLLLWTLRSYLAGLLLPMSPHSVARWHFLLRKLHYYLLSAGLLRPFQNWLHCLFCLVIL